MKKAILSKKDQIIHKLILYEVREKSGLLDKYISFDQLRSMYDEMVSVEGNHILLKNITGNDSYKRMSFFYESILHDYCKLFRVSEDQFKVLLMDHSNSLSELKAAIGYYDYKDAYKSFNAQPKDETPQEDVLYKDTPEEEVGFKRRF